MLISGVTLAANVPLPSGPYDPGNALGFFATLIQSINNNVAGLAYQQPVPVTTTGVSAFTFGSYTIPSNALAVGTSFSIHVAGVNSADTNAKTLTFNFGASSCSLTITGSGATWSADFLVNNTTVATQVSECKGVEGTSVLASVQATNWAINTAAPVTVNVQGTAATSGTITDNMLMMSFVR
ncbi:MAG: hypothetical protein KGI08_10445 [Thaumarchaeota archaeon]|nr:hypothetical protein [Nitrososphaerota archaeon]